MTAKQIRALLRYLPADGPYPGAIHSTCGSATRSFRERCLAICLNDAEFGFNFVMSFVSAGRTLPSSVLDINLRQAFDYFARNSTNDAMAEAYALVHPANIARRRILNALLVCRDTSLKQIAEAMSLPEKVVGIYEQLWFNVRDRIAEKSYVTSLVFPQTRLESTDLDTVGNEDHAQELIRTGHKYGRDEVLYIAGIAANRNSTTPAIKSAGEFEAILMEDALTQVRHGGANAKTAPAIDRAKTIIAACKRGGQPERIGDDVMGLGAIGAAYSVLSHIRAIQDPEIRQRIAMQREQRDVTPAARRASSVPA